jgi:hypothetical protein
LGVEAAAIEAAADLRAVDFVVDLPAADFRAAVLRAADFVVVLPAAEAVVVAENVAAEATAVREAVLTPPRCSAVWTPMATAFSIPRNSRGRRSS